MLTRKGIHSKSCHHYTAVQHSGSDYADVHLEISGCTDSRRFDFSVNRNTVCLPARADCRCAQLQLAAAAVTGFIAKENVVGTLAVCFVGLENLIDTEELALMEGAGAEVAGIIAITKVAALAYLMFNLYTPPCFAAIGAMNSEMKSAKWLWGGIGLQLSVGYTIGYLVYTVGTLITNPAALNTGAALGGLAAVAAMVLVIILLIRNTNKKLKTEYSLGKTEQKDFAMSK